MGVPAPFVVGTTRGTDHATPYTYDTHVPLASMDFLFSQGHSVLARNRSTW